MDIDNQFQNVAQQLTKIEERIGEISSKLKEYGVQVNIQSNDDVLSSQENNFKQTNGRKSGGKIAKIQGQIETKETKI